MSKEAPLTQDSMKLLLVTIISQQEQIYALQQQNIQQYNIISDQQSLISYYQYTIDVHNQILHSMLAKTRQESVDEFNRAVAGNNSQHDMNGSE